MNTVPTATHNLLKSHNARHMLHGFVSPITTDNKPPLIVGHGDGCYIFDIDGKSYLDGVAGLWNITLGHRHPVLNQAMKDQIDQIAYYKTFVDFSNGPAIELSRRVMELAKPEGMHKMFYGSGGSDAVETAIKFARQYWQAHGEGQRIKILSLKLGYHGVSFGGLSANGRGVFRRSYEPLLGGFFQVETPYTYRNIWNEEDPARLAKLCAEALEREILYQGADTVAAFLAEPVQGAGGIIVPHESYWPMVREICTKYGVLLISDEVICGFGRTGEMFGARAWGIKPDIMTFAKGINSGYVPLGATAISAEVESAFHIDGPFATVMHGYTYSGHALACAAGVATMEVLEKDNLLDNVTKRGEQLIEGFKTIASRFEVIGEGRGKGLMAALDLTRNPKTHEPFAPRDPLPRAIEDNCMKRGLVVRNQLGVVVVSPPFIITEEQVNFLLNTLEDSVKDAVAANPL